MTDVAIKPSVRLLGVQPQTVLGISFAIAVCQKHGVDFTLTSVSDPPHGRGSLHFKGYAFDMRTRDMTAEQRKVVWSDLREALGREYDVILEGTHIHVEYDPDN